MKQKDKMAQRTYHPFFGEQEDIEKSAIADLMNKIGRDSFIYPTLRRRVYPNGDYVKRTGMLVSYTKPKTKETK